MAIVGSVGKSTVARLLDQIARAAGLRTALRVDQAVETLGQGRGDAAHSWSDTLRRLQEGALDLTIEEWHWPEFPALTADGGTIGALVISTICPDRDVCRLDDTRAAISGVRSLLSAVSPGTLAIVDSDDAAFALLGEMGDRDIAVAAIRPEQPTLKRIYDKGGLVAWLEEGSLVVGRGPTRHCLGPVASFPLSLNGSSLFQARNLMAASLTATGIGLPHEVVALALRAFQASPVLLPSSLNVVQASTSRVLVDRASPSWFLSPLIKTLRSLGPGRLTCVADYPTSHPVDDLVEVGRILARQATAFVMIDADVGLAGVIGLRAGVAQSPHPPPIIHATTLPRAIRRALANTGDDDLTLVLSHRPELVYRILDGEDCAEVA